MILGIILIVIIAVVAYFHYLQGFFTAALSAVLTIFAAIIAVAYHETLIALLLKGQFADQASAIALVVVFAVAYIVPRVLFDKLIPGNVQFPLMLEKIGAGAMGAVAGFFVAGIFALAAQSLPFGSSVAGFQRYPFSSKSVTMIVGRRPEDVSFDLLDSKAYLENQGSSLMVPADNALLGLVSHVSDRNGSLSNQKPFAEVHPDYLQELFGQQVALQGGSKRAALADSVTFLDAFRVTQAPQDDNERWESLERAGRGVGIRHSAVQPPPEKLEPVFKPAPEHVGLVLRLQLGRISGDGKSGMVSFTPAGVRLAHNRKNYFPIGTLQDGKTVFRNDLDDVLFVPGDKAVDLLFEVPESVLRGGGDSGPSTIAPGVLVEFKRLALIDLSGKQVEASPKAGSNVEVLRKKGGPPGTVKPPAPPADGSPTPTPPPVAPRTTTAPPTSPPPTVTPSVTAPANMPMTLKGGLVADRPSLPSPLNVGTGEENVRNGQAAWGKFALLDGRFSQLELDPVQTVALMSKGENLVEAIWVAQGTSKLLSATFIPAGNNKWAWVDDLDAFELNAGGARARVNGVYVQLQNDRGQRMAWARFDTFKPVTRLSAPTSGEPLEVTLYYVVPIQAQLVSLDYKQQPIWKPPQ